jgi:hypothetical protein
MSRLRKICLSFGAIFLAGLVLIGVSFQHWWLRNVGSAVFVNGDYSDKANVFRNSNGDFLITENGQGYGGPYIYYSSTKEIGVPNANQFVFLGFCAYSKDLPVPVVLSSNRIKIETDMNIIERNEWIEFTGMDGQRIKLYRSNL